jgi:hypothetical protein
LFVHGRLRFHHPDGQPAKSSVGTPVCLVAYGDGAVRRLSSGAVAGTFVTWGTGGVVPSNAQDQ